MFFSSTLFALLAALSGLLVLLARRWLLALLLLTTLRVIALLLLSLFQLLFFCRFIGYLLRAFLGVYATLPDEVPVLKEHVSHTAENDAT